MSKALVTIATKEIREAALPFLENQRGYAIRNGFDHIVCNSVHPTFRRDLHPSFSKVGYVSDILHGYEYAIWADADVAFMDFNVDLCELVKPETGYWLAAYQQSNWPPKHWKGNNEKYLCAGLMVIRNCEESRRFVCDNWLQRVMNGYIVDKPWEQWYFHDLIQEINYRGIRCCTAKEIGCFCPELFHDGTIWEQGMPTIHMAGDAPFEERAEVFVKKYQALVKQ